MSEEMSKAADFENEKLLGELVCEYMDRLLGGEKILPDEINAAHPDLGPSILRELRTFTDLGSDEDSQPLGTLGDYTLRRQIGRGGMGVVYEAWQGSMDRVVALKVLPPGVAADNRAFLRFMREAKTAGQLNHQNVVAVYSTGVEEGTPWYSMEYVEGETLAQILARLEDAEAETETPFGKKSEEQFYLNLAKTFVDVADGLQHAHSKGVVHRDIKPSNLILNGEGRLRILDFGLARLEGQESLTISGDVVGTPLYMSPEQARRRKIPIDHRTDVYSLGATMYEALCSRPPFRGKDHADTLSQVIESDPFEPRKLQPRVPKDLETIVLKCLQKEAGDRYGTAEALGQDLRRFARGDPIEARPPERWRRWARQAWRHRLGLSAVVMTLLVLVAAASWGFDFRRQLEERRAAEYREVIFDAMDALGGRFSSLGSLVEARQEAGAAYLRGDSPLDATRKRMTATLRRLEAAADLSPERPEAYYYRAHAFLALKREEEALEELARAEAATPGFVPAKTLRAALFKRQGKEDLAQAELEQQGSTAASPWTDAWYRAQTAFLSGDWTAAETAYAELIEMEKPESDLHPGSSLEILLSQGIARLELGNHLGAARAFSAASDRWPKALSPGLLLGYSYLLMGDAGRAAAEEWFEEFFGRFFNEDTAVRDEVAFTIAATFRAWRDDSSALGWIGRMAPGSLKARAQILLYRRLEKHPDAARVADGVPPEQQDPVTLAFMGQALSVIPGRESEARSLLERAGSEGPPGSSPPAAQLSEAYYELQDWDEAIDWAEVAWNSEPNAVGLCNNFAWILLRAGHVEDALEVIDECLVLAAFSTRALHVKSACHLQLDQLDQAEEFARRALDSASSSSPNSIHRDLALSCLLRVRFQLGQFEEGIREYCEVMGDRASPGGLSEATGQICELLRLHPGLENESCLAGFVDEIIELCNSRQ